ncbi:MAG: alpha/beta fold hydrolase [bacterium]|nr:alpha/beta fold hydrolase [bacterium]
MATLRAPLTIVLIGCAPLASAVAASADDDAPVVRARELLALIVEGDFTKFYEVQNEEVRQALPAAKLQQIWLGLTQTFGNYGSEYRASTQPHGDLTVVVLMCQFERGDLKVTITLDQQDRVAGLFFAPDTSRVTYEPPDYVDQARFEEEEVSVSAGKYPLSGTLTVPRGKRPRRGFPGVVLVHGSGPHDRDETVFAHKPFRDLAWGLASRGIAVVRYEKRTHKYPAAHSNDTITLDDETIEDAAAAVAVLRGHDAVDLQRVFVVGHSLGAVAAPFVAAGDEKLAGIVLLAGCARPLADVLEDQLAYLAAVDGEVTAPERAQLDEVKAALAEFRAGNLDGDPAGGLPRRYLAMLNRYDPVATCRKLTLPILIGQGGRDYQVTMKDYRVWQQGLADRTNVTFRLFEDCDHLFSPGQGPSKPADYAEPGHVSRVVLDDLVGWIEDQPHPVNRNSPN